jgi:phosphatidylglycerophosphate synthase
VATRWCALRGVHPNTVTLWSWALAIAAALLFARGNFGIGLLCAWLMTFLDTVDGKLARVTLTSSRIGDVLDHGLDLIHPPFWWWAWGIGLGAGHAIATAVVVGGYFVGRALEGVFLAWFGFETHSWRPIDGLFRTITARRNPNLILLSVGALGGRPDLGLVMVAIWTAASLLFHALRLVQAALLRARGAELVPWEEA